LKTRGIFAPPGWQPGCAGLRIVRRRLLLVAVALCSILTGAVFAGPVWSGAVFMLLPDWSASVEHDLPLDYEPLHKGGVDLATGLYIREDEDLVVRGTPPLVLRRTYLSRYRASREFGVGTTHNGEWYLIGDGERFQWAALILPDGARIRFERTSPGMSLLNAMYEHHGSPTRFKGARLGWTGVNWAMRLPNGTLHTFRACGADGSSVCSLSETRDWDGHVTEYRRDPSGRLLSIATGGRWIAFDYDDRGRITRAHASTGEEVWYDYDPRGRLIRVRSADRAVRRYNYTDRDEMSAIVDPGILIENTYDENGRVIRQVDRFPADPEPLVWDFVYTIRDGAVISTESRRSDGGWRRFTFDPHGYFVAQEWRWRGAPEGAFSYTRDPVSKAITGVTIECLDRTGRLARHSSLVRSGQLSRIEADMVLTYCRPFEPVRRAPAQPTANVTPLEGE
jgi:YD repeat-containing protein